MEDQVFKFSKSILSEIGTIISYIILFIFMIPIPVVEFYYNVDIRIILVTVLFIILFPGIMIFWNILVIKNTKYEITKNFIISKKGVINLETNTLDIVKIKDIILKRSILNRILGLSNILLYTEDITDSRFPIYGIDKNIAQSIFDFINKHATENIVEYLNRGKSLGALK